MAAAAGDRGRGALAVTIRGFELPGRTCGPADAAECYENIHVGVQRLREVVELFPGDAPAASWTFDVTVVAKDDGGTDLRGPFVHGRRGDRFLYLSWGTLTDGAFGMFRRAKLHFEDCPPEVLAAALSHGGLRCRVRLTDACGNPRCARVRAPDAEWSAIRP